jgi:cytoskeletal protein CcmA (bactofilin family)
MSDLNVFGNPADFNEEVKFYKDVYVFGRLYYEFEDNPLEILGDVDVLGTANFSGPVIFNENVEFRKRLDVGIGGTTFTANSLLGKVGIGSTTPRQQLDIVGTAIISDRLGIGTANPTSNLTVNGNVLVTNGIARFESSTDVYLLGTVFDKFSTSGDVGQVLLTDANGAFWGDVSGIGTPLQTIGIYDENVFKGVVSNLNFIDGQDQNNLVGAAVTGSFADITISDRWSTSGADIFRLSKVGIQNPNPSTTLDVSGTFHVTGTVDFDSSLNVDGGTTLKSTLDVDGATNLSSTLNVDGTSTLVGLVQVNTGIVPDTDEGAYLGSSAFPFSDAHIGEIRIANSTNDNVIDTATGNLILNSADGTVDIQDNLDVDGATTLNSTLDVDGGTTLNSTLDVDGATTLNNTLDVDGGTTLNSTLDVDGATTLNSTLDVDGGTTLNSTLDVDGATTLQTTLQVGAAGTVITTTGIGSVGFGTNVPRRDIEFNNKDVFFNNGAIYDTNENVGYRDEVYQVPRNVLTTVGVDTAGSIISGRFFDAANLIRLNLDFIANESVGFITSTDYQDPPFTLTSNDYTSCKDDIKDIFKAITYDITRGGNSRCVGAGLSYYSGNTLIHIAGPGVADASIAAIEKAAEISRFVINNSFYPTSYQMSAINGTYADAGRLILRNKDFIAAEAVDRTKSTYPSLVIPGGNQNCIDDIKLILDAIIYNIQFGGNSRVYDAAKFYVLNPVLSGEEEESIYAYEEVKSVAIQVIRNETVTKNSGILNTFTQFIDLSVLPDPISPTCQNQASAVASFVGIVTNAIDSSVLPTRTDPTILIPISQIRDLTLQDDESRGSNTDPDGCSNVVSAITVCAGIVTTIIRRWTRCCPQILHIQMEKLFGLQQGQMLEHIIYVYKVW